MKKAARRTNRVKNTAGEGRFGISKRIIPLIFVEIPLFSHV